MNDKRDTHPASINHALWEFPHEMTLKVFGDAAVPPGALPLEDIVCGILARHLRDFVAQKISTRPSSGGRFIAISVDICVHDAAQVEGIYRDLRAEPRIRTAL